MATPTPTPVSVLLPESPSGTTIATPAGRIIDHDGVYWTLMSSATGYQVAIDGQPDSSTTAIVLLLYDNHLVYQIDKLGIWRSKASATASWVVTTDPLPAGKPAITPLLTAQIGTWQPFSYHGMEYLILLPHDYNSTHAYPLLIFLHQFGFETRQPEQVDPWFNTVKFRMAYPCVVLLPLCSIDGQSSSSSATMTWGGNDASPSLAQSYVITLLQQTIMRYSINLNKVYLTGTAMGATGTWSIIANPLYRKFFTAAMPLGGTYYDEAAADELATSLKKFPLWSVHGTHDTGISPAFDNAFRKATLAIGGIARYSSLIANADVWNTVYPNYTPYMDWLFVQSGSTVALPSALPFPPPIESPNGTSVNTVGPVLIDQNGELWSLIHSTAHGLQIAVNGIVDPTSANVVELVYDTHRVYRLTTTDEWAYKTVSTVSWTASAGPVIKASTASLRPVTAMVPNQTNGTVTASLEQLESLLQAALAVHPFRMDKLVAMALALVPTIKSAIAERKP